MLLSCSLLVFLLVPASAAAEAAVCWPLEMPTRYLTGNFMEPRGGRFHAGLDLKTNSRTGYAVRAAADGWISRVRVSAHGYGQALYLTAPDGTVYVYAHLERLRDDMRQMIQARQHELGGYEADLWLARGEVPVHCRDVLALSGQSAAAGPHLHFEVRGPDGQPRDPLAHGFAVADALPPEILAVRVSTTAAAAPRSWRYGDGTTPLGGSLPDLRLDGAPIFVSALIVDRSDRQRHRLGPWRVSLLADDEEVFRVVNDSLRWQHAHHQRLEFVTTPLGQELWLWKDERNTVPGRAAQDFLREGRWPPGEHRLRLVADDRAGNRAEVSWRLLIGADQDASDDAVGRGRGWTQDGDVRLAPWLVDETESPEYEGTAASGELQWRCGDLRDPVPERFWRLSGLRPVGSAVQYRTASGLALLAAVTVPLPEPALGPVPVGDDPALAIYRLQKRAWVYAAPVQTVTGGLSVRLDQPGVYRLLRDDDAPVIATAAVERELTRRPAVARHGISLSRWPLVKVPVADHGSGIAWHTVAVCIDGESIIAEPDPPRDRLLIELPDDLAPGRYDVRITAADRAGHRAQAQITLRLWLETAEKTASAESAR